MIFTIRLFPGIDASWNIAVHLARQYHLVFGKDFVFTYGPLEVLETRLPIAVNRFLYLVFDVYFLGTFVWIVRRLLKGKCRCGNADLPVSVRTGGRRHHAESMVFSLLPLFPVLLCRGEKLTGRCWGTAALLSVISLFIKVSLGMTTLAIFVAFLIFSVVFKRISIRQFALFSGIYAGAGPAFRLVAERIDPRIYKGESSIDQLL